jgi:hypothetical protein
VCVQLRKAIKEEEERRKKKKKERALGSCLVVKSKFHCSPRVRAHRDYNLFGFSSSSLNRRFFGNKKKRKKQYKSRERGETDD